MTLVQASICENGNTIIFIADRMVSSSMGEYIQYEKEGNSSKIFRFKNNVIGFAGVLPDIIKVKNRLELKDNFEEFLDNILKVMKDIKDEELERLIINESIWKNKEEFIQNQQICPPELKDFIFAKNAKSKLQINCLIAGFNKNNEAKIFSINNEYDVYDHSDLAYYSIGSGTPFSVIFFDQENYDNKCSLEEGLYFAYRAKKTAESHIGVGTQTDIIVLRKEDDPIIIYADNDLMKMLESLYNEEKTGNYELRKKIIIKINLREVN